MNKNNTTTLGNSIRRRREELGLTQDALARKLGYKSRSTINKIEKGINDITQTKIIAFAKALDTTPAALMGWELPPAKQGSGKLRQKPEKIGDMLFALATRADSLDEEDLREVCNFIDYLNNKKK